MPQRNFLLALFGFIVICTIVFGSSVSDRSAGSIAQISRSNSGTDYEPSLFFDSSYSILVSKLNHQVVDLQREVDVLRSVLELPEKYDRLSSQESFSGGTGLSIISTSPVGSLQGMFSLGHISQRKLTVIGNVGYNIDANGSGSSPWWNESVTQRVTMKPSQVFSQNGEASQGLAAFLWNPKKEQDVDLKYDFTDDEGEKYKGSHDFDFEPDGTIDGPLTFNGEFTVTQNGEDGTFSMDMTMDANPDAKATLSIDASGSATLTLTDTQSGLTGSSMGQLTGEGTSSNPYTATFADSTGSIVISWST